MDVNDCSSYNLRDFDNTFKGSTIILRKLRKIKPNGKSKTIIANGDLSSVEISKLMEYFSKYGKIEALRKINKRSVIIKYESYEAVEDALKLRLHKVDNIILDINISY